MQPGKEFCTHGHTDGIRRSHIKDGIVVLLFGFSSMLGAVEGEHAVGIDFAKLRCNNQQTVGICAVSWLDRDRIVHLKP
jgi:hypothetical protein